MVHKGDMKILAQMLKNIERQQGKVEFKAPLVVAPPTYNIVDVKSRRRLGSITKIFRF
jgi:aconitate hydratase 2/2-methylisocitrate dehydratase